MKTKRWLSLTLAILIAATLILPACDGKKADEGPDDKPIELVPAGEVIGKYSKDDRDHGSEPNEPTKFVRLHYRRNDDFKNDRSCYEPWNIWAWDMTNGGNGAAYDFTGYDDYGVFVDLDLALISGGKPIDKLGFIVRTDNWSKDPDGDRSIDIAAETPGGIQNVYVRTTEATVFYSQANALASVVSYAMLRDAKTISVYFKPISEEFKPYLPRFTVEVNGELFISRCITRSSGDIMSSPLISTCFHGRR